MGKVYLNSENKLVVETDNGIINPDGTSKANIIHEEKYYIEGVDLCHLMNAINKTKICIFSGHTSLIGHPSLMGYRSFLSYKILTDNEQSEKFNELIKIKDDEIKHLKDKIIEYNSNKKIFWRPIDIEDL